MTSKNACKKRWVQNPYYLRKLSIDGACELTGKQFFAHGSLSDSRNESCNLFSINSMQIYASEIIFISKFQMATRQYTDSLLYATPFHSFHSVYKAKQYSWYCSTNNLQKRVFSSMAHPKLRICHSCFSNIRKITCLSNAILNVFMHKKTYMYLYLSKGQQIFIYVYLKRMCFLLERYFFKKLGCLHIGGDVRILAE